MALDMEAEILRGGRELVKPTLRENLSYDIFRAPVYGYGIIDERFMEAYKDIVENLDNLGGITFFGENRFEYFQNIVPKLRKDFAVDLSKREVPLEVRLDPSRNDGMIGDCSFDKGLGLWKKSNTKDDSDGIYYGVNTNYYESMNRGIPYEKGSLTFSPDNYD